MSYAVRRYAAYLFLYLLNFSALPLLKAQEPRLMIPMGHNGTVNTLAFSADGKKILTGSADYTLKVWEARSGSLLLDLRQHTASVRHGAYSPDGKYIFSAALDSTAVLWDAMSGEVKAKLIGQEDDVNGFQFNEQSSKLVTWSEKTLKLWQISDEKLLQSFAVPPEVVSVAFEADSMLSVYTPLQKFRFAIASGLLRDSTNAPQLGMDVFALNKARTRIAAAADNYTIYIWNFLTGKELFQLKGHTDFVQKIIFSPDGKRLLTTAEDQTTKLWNVETGQLVATQKGQAATISFSPNGKYYLRHHARVEIRSSATGALVSTLKNFPQDEIHQVAFSGNNERVAVSSKFEEVAGIWNILSGTRITLLEAQTAYTTRAAFTKEGTQIITAGENSYLWNADTGGLIERTAVNMGYEHTVFSNDGSLRYKINGSKISIVTSDQQQIVLKGTFMQIKAIKFTPDNKKVIVIGQDSVITVWWTDKGTLFKDLGKQPGSISLLVTSADATTMLVGYDYKVATLWNLETGTEIISLSPAPGMVYDAKFSPDGHMLITRNFREDNIVVWDVKTGLIKTKLDNKHWVNSINFSPDGKLIVAGTYLKDIKLWNADTFEQLADIKGHADEVNDVTFSSSGKKILSASADKTAMLTDRDTGKKIFFKGHSGKLWTAAFSPDEKRVVTTSVDNTIKVWDAASGKLSYTFFAMDSVNYLLQVPSGFYMATREAARKLHYVTKDLKVITFQQLDVKYNRPDRVLEAIGSRDTALINAYKKAYEKRLRRLKIDTSAFTTGYSVPEADFKERNKLTTVQAQRILALRIEATDEMYKLERLNVWVNDVPIFGMRGLPITGKDKYKLDTLVNIVLSDGENVLETSVINSNGTESYRIPLTLTYVPVQKLPSKIFFAGIGINQFKEPDNNLTWSVKDIRDLAKRMKLEFGTRLVIVDTLFDKNVTAERIMAIKKKLEKTSVNDKVIIAYSGHGVLSKDFDYYLSTYNMSFQDPVQGGLSYEALENLVDQIPSRQKLLLIDACHSGEVDKEELLKLTRIAGSARIPGEVQSRGIEILPVLKDAKLGMKSSFELMRDIFVNVGKSTGATIISAAGGMQYALETSALKNGVFTYSMLETMSKYPSMKINSLQGIISKRVDKLTKGAQQPTSRTEQTKVNWLVW